MALPLHTRKRGREGATSDTARIGARTVMVEREVLINEFDELCWQQTNLRDVFLSRGWGNICTLRGKVYPSMVQEFYMGMCDMPQDASSHTVTVRGVSIEVSADVIGEHLGIRRGVETFAHSTPREDVGTSTSSTGRGCEPASARDAGQSEAEDTGVEARDDDRDEDFYILTGRDRMQIERKNAFNQNHLLHFFRMLHLIVATNVDPVAHKTTFSRLRAQFLIRVARGDPIDLPLHIFQRIRYEASIVSTDNLPYGVLISRLLLARGVPTQPEERVKDQMSPLDMTTHRRSIGQARGRQPPPVEDLVPPTQPEPGHVGSSSQHTPSTSAGDVRPAWVDAVISQLTAHIDHKIDRSLEAISASVAELTHRVTILNDKVDTLTEEVRSSTFADNVII